MPSFLVQYTEKNLRFALTVEPDNAKTKQKLSWAQHQQQANLPTIPSSIGEELETNPFMRVDIPELQVLHIFLAQPFSNLMPLIGMIPA